MKRAFDRLKTFARDDRGSISVETVLIFPLLLWGFIAMFVFWHVFKTENINLKATYTIADMISREDQAIDAAYIDGMNSIYQFLINSDDGNDIQVSVISVGLADDGSTPELDLEWSYATGSMVPVTDVSEVEDRLPMLAVGDELIVVQSEMQWTPLISKIPLMGNILTERKMKEFVFTAPRFVPQVLWDDSATAGSSGSTHTTYEPDAASGESTSGDTDAGGSDDVPGGGSGGTG